MSGPSPPSRLTPRIVLDAWRNITRRQIGTTFLLGLGLLLLHCLGVPGDPDEAARFLVAHFFADEIKAFALLLAVVAADRATRKDPDRRGAYALAIVGRYARFRNTTIVLGIKNLMDRAPPFTNVAPAGWDPFYADPRGRVFYARLTYAFK